MFFKMCRCSAGITGITVGDIFICDIAFNRTIPIKTVGLFQMFLLLLLTLFCFSFVQMLIDLKQAILQQNCSTGNYKNK